VTRRWLAAFGMALLAPALSMGQSPPGQPPPLVVLGTEDAFEHESVTGLPYSARTETEIVQTLADGNRIESRSSGFVARDALGRTRREQRLAAIGRFLPGPKGPRLTAIHDPVARVTYTLHPEDQTARRLSWADKASGESPGLADPPPLPLPPTPPHPRLDVHAANAPPPGETTPLGSRVVQGLSVQGTRYSIVIPAGQIGNSRPLTIWSERWYSLDLRAVVETRHFDPRFGETHFRLLAIERAEPDPSLFQVPPGFTVDDSSSRFGPR
jgi:hypothetical protein